MKDDSENLLNIPHIENAPISAPVAVAAVALNMSLKWHDISLVKDGTMYQALKMEGKKIQDIDLSDIFNVAKQFEVHLATAPERMANIVIDALASGMAANLANPIHPGQIIQEDLLPVLLNHNKLEQDQVAARIGITPDEFTEILKGEGSVTEKLARRIEKEFGFGAQQLIIAQREYDEAHTPKPTTNDTVGSLLESKLADLGVDNESAARQLDIEPFVLESILGDEEELDQAMIDRIGDTFAIDTELLEEANKRKKT